MNRIQILIEHEDCNKNWQFDVDIAFQNLAIIIFGIHIQSKQTLHFLRLKLSVCI